MHTRKSYPKPIDRAVINSRDSDQNFIEKLSNNFRWEFQFRHMAVVIDELFVIMKDEEFVDDSSDT
jgi:hypothetical protein